MSLLEVIVAVIGSLISFGIAYLAYRRGRGADEAAQENAEHTQLFTGYDALLKSVREDNAELRRSVAAAEEAAATIARAKADAEYVTALELRLDRCWSRMESGEKRIEKAEKELAECKKEMDEKIRALEARLK